MVLLGDWRDLRSQRLGGGTLPSSARLLYLALAFVIGSMLGELFVVVF